jgi:hypothetical protein
MPRGAIFIEMLAELSRTQLARSSCTSQGEKQNARRNNIPTAAQPGRTLRPFILPRVGRLKVEGALICLFAHHDLLHCLIIRQSAKARAALRQRSIGRYRGPPEDSSDALCTPPCSPAPWRRGCACLRRNRGASSTYIRAWSRSPPTGKITCFPLRLVCIRTSPLPRIR